jgi:tetratricopeptide (TPR) repeat protein
MKTKMLAGIIFLALVACAPPPQPEVQNISGDYNVHFSQGADFLKQKQYDRAIESLTKAVALRPEAPRAQNLLGMAYFLQENFKKAEEVFLKAIALDKNFTPAYINLGNVYFMQGQVDKAESTLKKTLSIAPQSVSALYSLGSLLLSQGQYEQGMAYLAQGVALDPDYLERQKDFTVSIASAGLNSPDTYFTWARVYAGQGNAAKAAEFLEKARNAGFKDWNRLETEKEFEKILGNPEIRRFRKTD